MKNYFKGFSVEEGLGNTAVDSQEKLSSYATDCAPRASPVS
jgi:hypothetical protein